MRHTNAANVIPVSPDQNRSCHQVVVSVCSCRCNEVPSTILGDEEGSRLHIWSWRRQRGSASRNVGRDPLDRGVPLGIRVDDLTPTPAAIEMLVHSGGERG